MNCEAVTSGLVAGELGPEHLAHLAGCVACRSRANLVHALDESAPEPAAIGVPEVPHGPTLARAHQGRVVRRVAVGAAVCLAAVALFSFARPAPPEPLAVDLLAILDDADSVVDPASDGLFDEDLLVLLEPGGEDPLATDNPLIDALLGEGSL